jgi:hypothetical protein
MKRPTTHILHYLSSTLTLLILFFAGPAGSESVIRIIGDRTVRGPDNSDAQAASNPPTSPAKGSTVIRIIGDKTETFQKKAPEKPADIVVTEKEHKAKATAEEEGLAKETPEEHLAQRLAALKEEEERKAAEKAVQEHIPTTQLRLTLY